MTYLVYQLTSPSGKLYIGMSGKTLNDRIGVHLTDRQRLINRGKQLPRFYSALGKYPIDQWKMEVLHEGLSKEMAQKHERTLIATLRTQDPAYGYNMADGGSGGNTGRNGEKAKREQHSARMKAMNQDPEYVNNRISKGQATIRNNPEQFKVNAEKRRMKLRRSSNHQNHTGMWVVRNVQYGSLREAVAGSGISESTIVNFCNKPDIVAKCTNKYLTIGTTPREHGFYRITKENMNGKI